MVEIIHCWDAQIKKDQIKIWDRLKEKNAFNKRMDTLILLTRLVK